MKIKPTYRTRSMWDDHYESEYDARGVEVFEDDRPRFSSVLGPDGTPLEYDYQPIGFDLRGQK